MHNHLLTKAYIFKARPQRPRSFRVERALGKYYPVEPRQEYRCAHVIRLDGIDYQCSRTHSHDGVHDANCRHNPDGGFVRW